MRLLASCIPTVTGTSLVEFTRQATAARQITLMDQGAYNW